MQQIYYAVFTLHKTAHYTKIHMYTEVPYKINLTFQQQLYKS